MKKANRILGRSAILILMLGLAKMLVFTDVAKSTISPNMEEGGGYYYCTCTDKWSSAIYLNHINLVECSNTCTAGIFYCYIYRYVEVPTT
jgi:hypothetical protein